MSSKGLCGRGLPQSGITEKGWNFWDMSPNWEVFGLLGALPSSLCSLAYGVNIFAVSTWSCMMHFLITDLKQGGQSVTASLSKLPANIILFLIWLRFNSDIHYGSEKLSITKQASSSKEKTTT